MCGREDGIIGFLDLIGVMYNKAVRNRPCGRSCVVGEKVQGWEV